MKFVGYETLAIRDLKLPGNWKEIKKDAGTARMKPTIERYGILQDPLVRKKDYLLVFGAHRLAAAAASGMEMAHFKLVDCTDLEVEALRRIENGARRHDVGWGKTNYDELVAMLTKEEEKIPPAEQMPTVSGREHSPKRRARERVASHLGIKSESVRQGERRSRRRKEKEASEKGKDKQIIETIGVPVNDDFVAQVAAIMEGLNESTTLLSRAAGILTSLNSRKLPMHDARFQRAKDALAEVGSALRGMVPHSLCPFCKGVDALQKLCVSCATTGYITRDQNRAIPEQLWDEKNPMVHVDGRLLPLGQFYGKEPDGVEEAFAEAEASADAELEEEERLQAEEDAAAEAQNTEEEPHEEAHEEDLSI